MSNQYAQSINAKIYQIHLGFVYLTAYMSYLIKKKKTWWGKRQAQNNVLGILPFK